MTNEVAGLLTELDRWLAEMHKVRFSCDGETAERVCHEIMLRVIMVGTAIEARVLDGIKIPDSAVSFIDIFDDAIDKIYTSSSLFPLTKHASLATFLDPPGADMTVILDITLHVLDSVHDANVIALNADLPGLFYERHVVTGKNKKGIVYTPVQVVKLIINKSIEPMLAELTRLAGEGGADHDGEKVQRAVSSLVDFSVLDPACGTGTFLVEAARLLHVARKRMEEITGTRLRGSPASQVHGIDEDPQAVDIARFNVALAAMIVTSGREASDLPDPARLVEKNVVVGNAITGLAVREEGKRFDVIVGNPPYVNYKKYLDRIDREFLEGNYEVFDGQADLSYYFFEIHARFLKEGGTSGQVSSRYFMQASHARHLREFLTRYQIVEIIDMNDCDVFGCVGIHPLLFFFKNCQPAPGHELVYKDIPAIGSSSNDEASLGLAIQRAPTKRVLQASLDAGGWCLLSTRELEIQARFDAHPSLGDLGDVLGGAETGFDEAFVKHVVMDVGKPFGLHGGKKYPLDRDLVHPWLKNGDIRNYHHASNRWCIYVPPDIDEPTFKARYPGTFAYLSCFKPGLEGRDNGRITVPWYAWRRPRNVKNLDVPQKIVMPYKAPCPRASIDAGRAYCSYDVTVFIPREGVPSLAYIAGLLNSAPAAWYFSTFGKRMGNIYEYYSGPVSKIRVPLPDAATEAAITRLVHAATEQARRLGTMNASGMEATIEAIDQLAVKLFGLDPAEASIVMGMRKKGKSKE